MSLIVMRTGKDSCGAAFDSFAGNESVRWTTSTRKVVRHAGGGLIGGVGSWRVIDLINKLKGENLTPENVIAFLKESGMEGEEFSDVIMVWPNRPIVFIQSTSMSHFELDSPFLAAGSGFDVAHGYLTCATDQLLGELDEKLLASAVKAATKWNPFVGPPIRTLTVR